MALTFPFAAIVGQDEMTLAIQVVAVDPSIGGVLVLGDRGTGKSTAAIGYCQVIWFPRHAPRGIAVVAIIKGIRMKDDHAA